MKILFIILVSIGLLLIISCSLYLILTRPIDKTSTVDVQLTIQSGTSRKGIAKLLKENNLIRSEILFDLVSRFHKKTLKAATYQLQRSMSQQEIIDVLTNGSKYNPDIIRLTFLEGEGIKKYALNIATNTDNTYEDVMNTLANQSYLQTLINEYWFLTDEILNENIYVSLEGYSFSGWTSSDVTISNNSFTMPSKNVVLKGSFTKKDTYTVSYSVSGAPDGYLTPDDKDYGVGDDVTIDSLKAGDEVNGYRFLGWTSSDVDLSEGIFTMPKKNVKLIGKFEKMNYKVTYKFQGSTIPDNADSLLPEEKYYYPGDTVKVANNPKISGYRFLGWYKEKTFEMPNSDVIIYGEWMVENGVFSPKITRVIDGKKKSYRENEIISSTIKVKNTASYPISNVRVEESADGSYFVPSTGYEVLSNSMVNIPSIAAGSSVVLKTEYVSTSDLQKKVVSEALITGATASNNYYLDISKDYKADVEFLIFNPLLKINIKDRKNNLLTGYEFGLYSDKDTSNLISKRVEFDNLEVGKTYYLRQISAPSGYSKLNKTLTVVVSEDGKISIDGYELRMDDDVLVLSINSSKLIFANLPNTLDSILIYLGLFVISVVIIIGIVIYIKKVKSKATKQDKDSDIEVL